MLQNPHSEAMRLMGVSASASMCFARAMRRSWISREVESLAFGREIDDGNVGASEPADGRKAGRTVAQCSYHAVAAPF